jgi:lipopolysaccharide assembly protein B
MVDTWQLLLVFSAIAIGWVLGRFSKPRDSGDDDHSHAYPQYYKGLNYLLNDRPDSALDSFIEALEVNSETLETHLAVGNLMRRKGEVDRAIRIHQNLLSRPSISVVHLHQAHLELARDFISAGLLDRAERLLEDLLKEAPELREVSIGHLLEVYQDEREWQKAIDLAHQLVPKKSLLKATKPADESITRALSHYCCELAELAIEKNDYHRARASLKQALGYDRDCVRASLLMADIESRTEHYSDAVRCLRKVRAQDPAFLPQTLPILKSCYSKLGNDQGFQQYLRECLDTHPSATVMLALADYIENTESDKAAVTFISRELKRNPSMRGLAKLIELHVVNSDGRVKENLTLLQSLIEQLIDGQPLFQCNHCGFSGHQLHWMCPSCKHWGEVKSTRGIKGD